MAHPNEDVVRAYLRAFNEGDLETVEAALDDGVVIHFPGRSPLAGEKRGKQEVIPFFKAMMTRVGVASVPADIHDVLANDNHVVVLITRSVAGIKAPVVMVYHVRDGRIIDVWWHERDQYAVDEALSRLIQPSSG